MGRANGPWSPGFPLWSITGLLARAGFGWAAGERVAWLWPYLALSVAAPYFLVYRLTRVPLAAALAASIFALNTWTIALVQRGHIPSLDAYAILPLVVWASMRLLQQPTPARSLAWVALLTAQILYDLRYAYIALIACAVFALVWLTRTGFSRFVPLLKVVPWMLAGAIAFNAYWLLPQFAAPAGLPVGYDMLEGLLSASSVQTLAYSLTLFAPFYHYVQGSNGFSAAAVEPAFYVIVIAAAISLVLVRRRVYAVALGILAIASIAIVAGPASPIGWVDRFAFLHVPGMKLFRDISKFTALEAFSFAAIIGLGFARFAAILRARALPGGRGLVVACAVVAIGLYGLLMRDAYNPIRFSNFAAATHTAQDEQLQRFLDAQPGYFRTLIFPTLRPNLLSTDVHPLAAADYFTFFLPSDGGVADVFSEAEPLLQRFKSPLIPAWLAQGSVRYLIIADDRTGTLYAPFTYGVQYAESVEFFARQPWLREVARFGRNRVFATVLAPSAGAFAARNPTVLIGPSASLLALVGSPLWQARAAVAIADPQRPGSGPAGINTFPNAVQAMRPLPGQAASPLSSALQYRGWATYSPTVAPLDIPTKSFRGSFWTTAGKAAILTRVEPWADPSAPLKYRRFARAADLKKQLRTLAPPLVENNYAIEIDDPNIMRAPPDGLDDPNAFGIIGPHGSITIVNLGDSRERADIVLPAVAAAGPDDQPVVLRLPGTMGSYDLPGRGRLIRTGPSQLVLRDVELMPGSNRLDITTFHGGSTKASRSAFSLFFSGNIEVQRPVPALPTWPVAPLPVSAASTPRGVALIAGPLPRDAYARANFEIFDHLDVPLANHPRLSLRYGITPGALTLLLICRLRQKNGVAREYSYDALLDSEQTPESDVTAGVQAALDAQRRTDVAIHSGNGRWMLEHSRDGSREASEFHLTSVDLAIVKLPGARLDRQRRAVVRDARLTADRQAFSITRAARSLAGLSLVNIDRVPYPIVASKSDTLTGVLTGSSGLALLRAGEHELAARSMPPYRPASVLVSQGQLRQAPSAPVTDFREISASEFGAWVPPDAGVLVLPVAYSPGWKLALRTSGAAALTGVAPFDAWVLRNSFVAESKHIRADDIWNAWMVPPGAWRATFLYYPEVYSQIGIVITLGLTPLLIALALRRAGGRTNEKNPRLQAASPAAQP